MDQSKFKVSLLWEIKYEDNDPESSLDEGTTFIVAGSIEHALKIFDEHEGDEINIADVNSIKYIGTVMYEQ